MTIDSGFLGEDIAVARTEDAGGPHDDVADVESIASGVIDDLHRPDARCTLAAMVWYVSSFPASACCEVSPSAKR